MSKFSEMDTSIIEGLNSGNGLNEGSARGKGGGRKEEVLVILKGGAYGIEELGKIVGVSSRNISSVLCYLKDDGYIFKWMGNKVVLWSKIKGSKERVGNRVVKGTKGEEVRFDFKLMKFADEVKK